MAEGYTYEDEYQYFNTFVKYTHKKYSKDENLSMMQIQHHTLEIMEEAIHEDKTKAHTPDRDQIKFTCAHVLALVFSMCQGHYMRYISPCLPTRYLVERVIHNHEKFTLNKRMLSALKNLTGTYIRYMEFPYGRGHDGHLQNAVYDFTAMLWEITRLESIHDLMSLKIQMHCHNHVIMERYHAKISKPFMDYTYRALEITKTAHHEGWKYYWNPKSHKLLELLNEGEQNLIEYGKAYDLDALTSKVRNAIIRKLCSPDCNEKDLISSLSNIFQLQSDEINTRDKNTLLWPVLQHTYCLTFEEIFNQQFFPHISEILQNEQRSEMEPNRKRKRTEIEEERKRANTASPEDATQTSEHTESTHKPTSTTVSVTGGHPVKVEGSDSGYSTGESAGGYSIDPNMITLTVDPDTLDVEVLDLSDPILNLLYNDGQRI